MPALTLGQRLGPYEVQSRIGAGGMGEVYKAWDTRLGREVAIKVSGVQFTNRFEREVRSVAALNHPNICTLYDVGPNYLVMELIEGETLKGPAPLETALHYARQIVSALEAAHHKGIVHRDLKPANIRIKPDGTVKVLDFGLAKVLAPISGSQNPENVPTLTGGGTLVGVILGTPAYMSPEQARGDPVDQRADVWAFGVVLYEMLVGLQPFEAATVSDTLAAVLTKEPDLGRVPPQLNLLLRRCLAKDPQQRLHHIADVRLLLDETAGPVTSPLDPSVPSRIGMIAWIITAVAVIGMAAFAFTHWREKPGSRELARFQIFPPHTGRFAGSDALVSPDGRLVAFGSPGPDGRAQLWVRSLDSLDSRLLAGTDGVVNSSFWSPDSRFLGFAVQGKLKKVDTAGGPVQPVCDIPGRWRGGAWSPDGVIIFGTNATALWQVAHTGGTPSPLTKLDLSRKESFHLAPSFLPDGRHFLYIRNAAAEDSTGVYVGSLDAKPEQQSSKRLLGGLRNPIYVAASDPRSGGHMLFIRGTSLMAQAFDIRRLELAGEAVAVAEGLPGGAPAFSASTTGVLAYRTETAGGGLARAMKQLTWLSREGVALGTSAQPAAYDTLTLSPDGARVAVSRIESQIANGLSPTPYDIWVHEFARTSTRLTSDSAIDWFPTWSPDGSRIIFSSERGGAVFNLYQKASNGAGAEEPLFKSNDDKSAQDWSRDGRFLLYSVSVRGNPASREAAHDLWVFPLGSDISSDRGPKPYLQTEFNESQGRFSPDGKFIAYRSDASGRDEIYVQPFPTSSGGKWTISTGGGVAPRWRPDGKELFYIAADSKMMAVEVSTDPIFKAGAPKPLFQAPIWGGGQTNNVTRYDVTADGKKFLMISAPPEANAPAASPIILVMNWTALLKK